MKISGTGLAFNGCNAIKLRKEMHMARAAVTCFHDALLAVARGIITPEQVKEFFWANDLDQAQFYGEVLSFTEEKDPTP